MLRTPPHNRTVTVASLRLRLRLLAPADQLEYWGSTSPGETANAALKAHHDDRPRPPRRPGRGCLTGRTSLSPATAPHREPGQGGAARVVPVALGAVSAVSRASGASLAVTTFQLLASPLWGCAAAGPGGGRCQVWWVSPLRLWPGPATSQAASLASLNPSDRSQVTHTTGTQQVGDAPCGIEPVAAVGATPVTIKF